MNFMRARRFKGIIVLWIILFGAGPTGSTARIIYDLAAICDAGCAGTATGVLTLSDAYIPGLSVDNGDFIAFSFSSSSGTLDLDSLAALGFNATMPVVLGTANFQLVNAAAGFLFETKPSGDWTWVRGGSGDEGSSHIWTLRTDAVPEPPPSLLFVFGLLIIGLLVRLRSNEW